MQLEEDDLPYRKGSNATVRSEGTGTEYYAKVNISIKHQLSFLKWKKVVKVTIFYYKVNLSILMKVSRVKEEGF